MSTDVVSGDTAYRSDSPAPAPEPMQLDPVEKTDAPFTVEQLGEMAEHNADMRVSEKDWLDNASAELKIKRDLRGDGLPDERPVVEVRAAETDRPYSLKEASRELSEAHRVQKASDALRRARAIVGSNHPITEADIRRHDLFNQQLSEQTEHYGEKPSEIPFNPLGMIEDGKFVKPLADDQKVTLDEALTPRQAAKQIGNWREWQERAQNELVEALRGEEAQRQVVEVAQQIQQPQPRPAQPAQQQRPQPQVDPVAAAQRQRLAAQQA